MAVSKFVADKLKQFESLKNLRYSCEGHWQEIADYVLPRKANVTKTRAKGDKRTELIYDATAIHALELLAASLHGMLTNPSTRNTRIIYGPYCFWNCLFIPRRF